MKTANAAVPEDVLPGQIKISRAASGYYFIQIGRLKYTKRFNLSPAEAEAIIEELGAALSSTR